MRIRPPLGSTRRDLPRALRLAGWAALATGCTAQDGSDAQRDRPPIEAVEQRVCLGRPLPLNHIDEIVPAGDGRLALIGRRTALADPGPGIETVGWVVAVLDPAAPDDIQVIERFDPNDRPTPIAWRDGRLWVTRDRSRLVPADDPDSAGITPPFGVPPLFDSETPQMRLSGDRSFMILGEPSPRGETLRTFVEVERGDPEAGTVDRVVATYGTLQHQAFSFGLDEEMAGRRFVEAVGIVDWHLGADGRLTVMGWAQSFIGPLDFWYRGTRHAVVSDVEAGWFGESALEQGTGYTYIDQLADRISYDLRADDEDAAELVFYDPRGGPSTTPFWDNALPAGRTVYDFPPPFARDIKVTAVEAIGDDLLLAGSACVEAPYDDTLFEQPRCRAFVSRQIGHGEESRWTVTVDADDLDYVIDLRRDDSRLLVLAAAFDVPQGRGTSISPARLVFLDRTGHCLEE